MELLNKSSHWTSFDTEYVWHPYSAMHANMPVFAVKSARGVLITLDDGRQLVDGMSSWWCAIHGYNHPRLNEAVAQQLDSMAHVMFGGLTHEPAARLARNLVEITPPLLQTVFFADSGSVAVEVAMKMAIQYWHALGQPNKQRFLTIRGGYHGDTFGAMSVCDPVTGMHNLFAKVLTRQFFIEKPRSRFGEPCDERDLNALQQVLKQHHDELAAVILEPVVQGAGGMYFYSADYLAQVRRLCDKYEVLLVTDEIATGFGRSGKLFACEHADISPDIMTVGKAMTGGYMTLAATLASEQVSTTISQHEPGVFMHGPTFMANPLACAVANASIDLLLESDWESRIAQIEEWLLSGLESCQDLPQVREVRVLGAIGVVELHQPVDMKIVQPAFVEQGVWVRPFGRLVYLMPPFVIEEQQIAMLCDAVFQVVRNLPR